MICTALLLQLTVGGALTLRRRHRVQRQTAGAAAPVGTQAGPGVWTGWRTFRVLRRRAEYAGGSQCSFHLQPVDALPLPPFAPGQYLTVSLAVDDGARTITRCNSWFDTPDPAQYRITVKRVPAPADRPALPPDKASNFLHKHVQAGDVLQLRAPAGRFYIDDSDAPLVLVAGGIGITPMMSMLRWCLAVQPARPGHLFDGLAHRQRFLP